MAKLGSVVVALVLLVNILHAAGARRDPTLLRTSLSWVPAVIIGENLTERACIPASLSDGMYVAVPPYIFRNGEACNRRLKVSCSEPFQDLGGPWNVCKNRRDIHYLTVIDEVPGEQMDDDLFLISPLAFKRMADPRTGLIRLWIRDR